jgi:hypothetical protein
MALVTTTYIVGSSAIGHRALKFSDTDIRKPGELIPEAAVWKPRVREAYLSQGFIEEVKLVSDAERQAAADQYEAESVARAEAARNAPKSEPPKPVAKPKQEEPALRLPCANCGTVIAFPELPARDARTLCPYCGQRQTVAQMRQRSLVQYG